MSKYVCDLGEDIAAEAVAHAGYSILARNFRCRWGELDIVACRDSEIIFVEVKTRTGSGFGQPQDAVTAGKRKRIKKAALWYVSQQQGEGFTYRFDVICVSRCQGNWKWQWYKDAFV